jgi:hypothetical protein
VGFLRQQGALTKDGASFVRTVCITEASDLLAGELHNIGGYENKFT